MTATPSASKPPTSFPPITKTCITLTHNPTKAHSSSPGCRPRTCSCRSDLGTRCSALAATVEPSQALRRGPRLGWGTHAPNACSRRNPTHEGQDSGLRNSLTIGVRGEVCGDCTAPVPNRDSMTVFPVVVNENDINLRPMTFSGVVWSGRQIIARVTDMPLYSASACRSIDMRRILFLGGLWVVYL